MTEELELKFIKFADGELTPDEESCVLLDCEESPQQWKELALAMVAQRRLTEAFAVFEEAAPSAQTQKQPGDIAVRANSTSAASRWHSAARLAGMSLALLLAFLVGKQQVTRQQPLVAEVEPSPLLPEDDTQPRHGELVSSGNDDVMDDQALAVNPWTVVSKPVITEEDRNAFSDAGLDVIEENTIYIVNDADGGRWAIPWKAVNVRYSPTE